MVRIEERARAEVQPGPSSPLPNEETVPPSSSVPWARDIEDLLGRSLAATDCAGGNPHVVVALGRSCALPLDVSNWERMDDPSLMVSAMRSAVAVSSLPRILVAFQYFLLTSLLFCK